jgi:EmrB/QacA subfamily drug resistance transporter
LRALNVFHGMSREEVRLLVILGAGAFMLASSLNSINVALPEIQREFDISLSALKWVSIIGGIMVASLSLCFGRLGDLVGRKKIYRLGIFVYAFGALLTATSFSFPQMMVFRVIMACGLAMSNPLAGAIMAATVAQERRGQVMGLFASFQAAGMLIGPSFGGLILDLVSWRGIFVAYTLIGMTLVVVQHFVLRGVEERRFEPFDFLGAVLLVVGYPALLIALSFGPGSGWDAPITLFWFGVAAIGLVSFGIREARYEKPIFHFRFFRSLSFCIAMFTLVVASFVQNPMTLFAPIYLQKVLSIDPFQVGLVMMALPISTLIAGPIGGRMADRYNARLIAAFGALLTFLAVFFYAQLGVDTALLFVVVPLVLLGVGGGFFRPANQVAVYASAERTDYGALTAMLVLLQSLAGTLGATLTIALTESRTKGSDDPAAFTEAQQFTFTALLPLLLASVFVSLIGRSTAKKEPEPASAATSAAR